MTEPLGTPIGAFFLIGYCVWSWLLALISGWFAGRLNAKREKLQKTQPCVSASPSATCSALTERGFFLRNRFGASISTV
jgi:hypothetical protein